MLSTHILCLIIIFLTDTPYAYYLSYNTLHRSDAESYCVNQCQSHLASIHNINDYDTLLKLWETDRIFSSPNIAYGEDLWIGLSDDQTNNTFYWSDSTRFDFGSNISGGIYPWTSNEPGSASYVHIVNNSNNLLWKTVTDNEQYSIFACNDCTWNVINKFIIVPWQYNTWDDAEKFCYNQFGTTLASLHSQTDFDEAKTLCQYQVNNCFIGLQDKATAYDFIWSDGTSFDLGLGSQTNGFPFPWANNEPNNYEGTDDCVGLSVAQVYEWDDMKCSASIPFICNQPSELCYASNWDGVDNKWTFGICEVTNNNYGSGYNMITLDISDKQWKPITVSYRWKINQYYFGKTGIVINIQGYDDNIIYPFFIAFEFIDKGGGNDQIDSIIEFNRTVFYREYNYDWIWDQTGFTYNEMRVELDINCIFNAYLIYSTNKHQIAYSVSICDKIPKNYFIKNVGIQNYQIPTTSKSFFINGAYNTDAPTNMPTTNPSYYPTNYPSYSPTKTPTIPTLNPTGTGMPTTDPSQLPTSNPTQIPTFNPTLQPVTFPPTIIPTYNPTFNPTIIPTFHPFITPTIYPTYLPSILPTIIPTHSESVVDDISTTDITGNDNIVSQNNSLFNLSELVLGMILGAIIFGLFIIVILIICICYVKKLKKRIKSVSEEKQAQKDQEQLYQNKNNTVEMTIVSTDILTVLPAIINQPNNELEGVTSNYSLGHDIQSNSSSSSDEMYTQQPLENENENENNNYLTPFTSPIQSPVQKPKSPPKRTLSNASDEDLYRADLVTNSAQTPINSTPEFKPQ